MTRSRTPALLVCIVLGLGLGGFALVWQWHRWDSEWLRPLPEMVFMEADPEVMITIRADNVSSDDPRFIAFKTAAIIGLAGLKWTAREGLQGSRDWPRTYAWYTFWMPKDECTEEFVARYRTRVAEELSRRDLAVRWRMGCVEEDGTVRYSASVDY